MSGLPKRFPYEDGWTMATLTMKSTATVTFHELFRNIGFGNPEDVELGEFTQRGSRVRMIWRKKPTPANPPAQS